MKNSSLSRLILITLVRQQVVAGFGFGDDGAAEFAFQLSAGGFGYAATFFGNSCLTFVAFGVALLGELCCRSFSQDVEGYFEVGHVVAKVFLLQAFVTLVLFWTESVGKAVLYQLHLSGASCRQKPVVSTGYNL